MADRETLLALAAELRSLPGRGDSSGECLESAGRLLLAAINAGAFAGSKYAPFREMVKQRAEQHVNGWISAWSEAVWWLSGKSNGPHDLEKSFTDDCRMVAELIDAEARTRKKRAGRPPKEEPDDVDKVVDGIIERGDDTTHRWADLHRKYADELPRDYTKDALRLRIIRRLSNSGER